MTHDLDLALVAAQALDMDPKEYLENLNQLNQGNDVINDMTHNEQMLLEQRHWQNLVDLQARLSDYLRKITEPPEME